jgi:MFS family permease
LLVAFCLGQLGDGLNIFQGIYLVGMGWNESSVGTALSLMGLISLLVQPIAGDYVDKTTMDRRLFLVLASIVTAVSASTILLVKPGNLQSDHVMMYSSKVLEGMASSFIGPCLAALTLATFGPNRFDDAMASNILWGHVGSVMSAVLAGLVAFSFYPNIQYCFYVISASALVAIIFVQSLPQGDPLMGRGFQGKVAVDQEVIIEL